MASETFLVRATRFVIPLLPDPLKFLKGSRSPVTMLARIGFCICPLISIVGIAPALATDIPALVQKAKPAVVEILTYDQQNKLLKTGTGFFISPDGALLTNYHVISGGSSIMAKTPTGAVYF